MATYNLLMILLLLSITYVVHGIFLRKHVHSAKVYCNYHPTSNCKISVSSANEPNYCQARRNKSVQVSRKFYKLTRLGDKKVIKFPLQFIPFLNQTMDTVKFHTALDAVDSKWLAQMGAFQGVVSKMQKGMEKQFMNTNFTQESDYVNIFRLHKKMISGIQSPRHFSNPSLYSTFTDIISNQRYLSDDIFVQKRLAGPCPFLLKLVTTDGHVGFAWDVLSKLLNRDYDFDEALQSALKVENITVKEATRQGILYVLHHKEHNDFENVPDYYFDKVNHTLLNVTSPVTLFARTNEGELVVVAIQMDYKNTSNVFSPHSDAFEWTLAKAMVDLTDLNVCQAIWHYSHVHLSAGVYCTIFRSHLSELHPLYQIMRYHCEGTTPHMALAYGALVAPNMYGEKLFSITNTGFVNLTVQAFNNFEYGVLAYDNILRKHGLNSKKIRYHPFRDDGEVLWNGFKGFANDFTDAYYNNNSDVENDAELQSFAKQVSSKGGPGDSYGGKGNIVGFPCTFKTKEQVRTFVTRFLWQIGIHGAVNYPLEPWAAFVPLLPTKLYDNTKTYYEALPEKRTTVGATSFATLLGNMRVNRIFDYHGNMEDYGLRKLVKKYHHIFNDCIQHLLEKRNSERETKGRLTFQYFEPKWLTNSIHV